MILVVDASVIAKLFLNEPGHGQARDLVRDHRAIAPNFARIEVANVLWKKFRRQEIDRSQALEPLGVLGYGLVEFMDDNPY